MSSIASSSSSSPVSQADKNRPWWRYPIVWMVIGGPAAVVVACIYTIHLALANVDPVLDTSVGKVGTPSLAPANQGRNRAAQTGAEQMGAKPMGAEYGNRASQAPADR